MVNVRLENLVKKFEDVVAVNDLNLLIRDKEFICLLGPSGCGKTTTLRCIAGLETPTSGEIYFDEDKVTHLAPKERDVAYVFQFYVIYPGLSTFDQIAFPLKVRGYPKEEIRKRVKEVTELLRIEHILDKPISRLTVDERQRIELARALIRQPKVYLLDEPLTNLDAGLRSYMRAEIKSLFKKLGTTTIYVTHDQIEAMSMADRIAVMNQGILQQVGTPDELYNNPRNLFVAGFIGSPAMNMINCTLIEEHENTYLDAGEFKYKLPRLMVETIKRQMSSRELILGVRPEDVLISPTRQENAVKARVAIIEVIGHRMIVHVDIGKYMTVKANIPRQEIKPDQDVWITFDVNKVHIFDKAGGSALI
ncbi:MAG: ABC transporter ATP-binding protein [Nitrososphaeria archaeon]|nr:ABC transporter ATP-binding protein [Nitrososphaeria archaeon]